MPDVTQRFVAKGLAHGTVANVERVVQPEAVVAATRADAQITGLAVDIKVIQAAVRECLEADRLEGAGRRGTVAVRRRQRRAAGQVCGIGRRRGRQGRQRRRTPQKALAISKVRWCRVWVFGEVCAKGLFYFHCQHQRHHFLQEDVTEGKRTPPS